MPAGGPTAASSLYSGIFPTKEEKEADGGSSLVTKDRDGSGRQDTDADKVSPPKEKEDASSVKPQAWSAALRFAPRKNTSQINKSRRPLTSALVSANFSTAPVPMESEPPVQVQASKDSLKFESKIATATQPSSSKGWNKLGESSQIPKRQVQFDALRVSNADESASYSLPIVTAPPELNISSEELERDRALFAELAAQRGEGKVAQQDDQIWYEEEEEGEDVNGFGNTDAGRRARRKKNKRKRHNSPGRQAASAASLKMDADYDVRLPNDYSQIKDLVRKRREAIRRAEQTRKAQEELDGDEDHSEDMDQSDEENDDETYRRLKMNRFAPPSTYSTNPSKSLTIQEEEDDEKPYLSPPSSVPPTLPASSHVTPPALETGKEAYLRRLAMSQVSTGSSKVAITESTSIPSQTAIPDFAARAAAAAAIAAKLAKAGSSHSQSSSVTPATTKLSFMPASSLSSSSQNASFAQKLMEKQGWKEGEALGAEGNKGLIDPILAKKVESARAKERDHHEKKATSNRGTLINTHDEEKRREEREKFGIPSEIILLENMVNLNDIDDELSDEIREECAKHGYVERVFIWPQGPKGVRIFVKFSGMAGAWRCVKELEGRFFGGKTVRARYYPLMDFERGDYMNIYSSS